MTHDEMAQQLLVVDDDDAICRMLSRIAEDAGFVVQTTSNADEFRAAVQRQCPDCILLDLNVPGGDGIELMRFLAANARGVRIAILSGAERAVLNSARRIGESRGLRVVDVVQKPAGLERLRQAMECLRDDGARLTTDDLAHAIDGGELRLQYQPRFSLPQEACEGFEALVRWAHPRRGLIPPVEFIPLAERSGLINRLTWWVVGTALDQLRVWDRSDVSLSINVSGKDLRDLDFADRFTSEMHTRQVRPAQVILELTETVAMSDIVMGMDILTRLRLRGVGLSIDDFGTGFSSLVQLQRLPAGELKIDRAFVRDCHVSDDNRVIVKTIVDLAHNLGMQVVAEGVEEPAVLEILKGFGCDGAQGYLLGRPLDALQATELLDRTHLQRGDGGAAMKTTAR